MLGTGGCAITVRRFSGPVADELSIVCRPDDLFRDAGRQAERVYRTLTAALGAHGASPGNLTSEMLFLGDDRDFQAVRRARTRALGGVGRGAGAPEPVVIRQPPVAAGASFELQARAVIAHRPELWSVRDVRADPACACAGCTASTARLVRLGEEESLFTNNVHGSPGGSYEQAWSMFCAAEALLERCGLEFRDVVRTWIHLRDIGRDYDVLNRVRREFFGQRGIALRPASTGVEGAPLPGAHDFSLSLHAVRSTGGVRVARMSTPLLNEAWSYGGDFSRGVKVVEANKVALHVSGTASIDAKGGSVHAGDFAAQADRMLDNIESLLAGNGAGFDDVASAVAYLKDRRDAAALRAIFRRRGFDGFPCALVKAALCRPELLCETEVVAVLPPAAVE